MLSVFPLPHIVHPCVYLSEGFSYIVSLFSFIFLFYSFKISLVFGKRQANLTFLYYPEINDDRSISAFFTVLSSE